MIAAAQRRTQTAARQGDLIADLSGELAAKFPGIEWDFSQYIRDNVMEAISGVKGDNSVKIFGPDLDKLEDLAEKTKNALAKIHGIYDVGIYRIMGQSNLEFAVDKDKCKYWGVQVADVNNVINTAVQARPSTQMIEGERGPSTLRCAGPSIAARTRNPSISPWTFRTTSSRRHRFPASQTTVGPDRSPGRPRPARRPPAPPSASTCAVVQLVLAARAAALPGLAGRRRWPPRSDSDSFIRPGGSIIAREQGKRFIAVKFSVRIATWPHRGRGARSRKTIERNLSEPPYSFSRWSGEFEQMERRRGPACLIIIPASLVLIFMLLYFAFRSLLDAVVVLSNVLSASSAASGPCT